MNRRHLLIWLCCLRVPLAGAEKVKDRQVACARLDARIADVRLKLRLGYTARQGRLYRQKLAGLEAERKAACR